MVYQAHIGHIAPALCITDILTVLYFRILRLDPQHHTNPLRDRFILSKGHAAAAFYATLARRGFIQRKDLFTYCREGGLLGTHPDYQPQLGIELTTGSLGHGLPVGVGMAIALRKIAKNRPRVFVLLSDAELNEGSNWEAMMFAAHHKLDNLVVIVDDNGLQAFGRTKDVLNLQPLSKKWKAFGWHTLEVNGHSTSELIKALDPVPKIPGKPTVIIAKTIGGKGVSFMENKVEWHYWPIDQKQYLRALRDIKKFK